MAYPNYRQILGKNSTTHVHSLTFESKSKVRISKNTTSILNFIISQYSICSSIPVFLTCFLPPKKVCGLLVGVLFACKTFILFTRLSISKSFSKTFVTYKKNLSSVRTLLSNLCFFPTISSGVVYSLHLHPHPPENILSSAQTASKWIPNIWQQSITIANNFKKVTSSS